MGNKKDNKISHGFLEKMFFGNRSIGIDLGTVNTLVFSKKQNKIILNEPSIVAIDVEKKEVLEVGFAAKDMVGKTPDSIKAIRPLSEGVIADYDITEAMIKYFIKKASKTSMFAPEVMICVPVEVTGVEKRAVLDAALSAGAKRAYLIEEARVAALGSNMDISEAEGNMIIDIGGGSTDVAVISLGSTVVSKTIRIAGNNFDNDIIKYIKKTHNLLIGDRTAEAIKIKIATALPLDEEESMEVKGRDIIKGLPKTITITSEEVREAISDSLNAILSCIKSVLEETPPELASDIVDKGMVMTGGGSLIRFFPEMIANATNLKVTLAENPLESVVLGIGKALDIISKLRQIDSAER